MNKIANVDRLHIAIVGKRNVGKSSLINCLTNQELSIVSETPGTTTDSVSKAVGILPYGPVVVVDSAGIDNVGELNEKRINRTINSLAKTDFAILVLDAREGLNKSETELITILQKVEIPFLAVVNKIEFGINPHLLTELEALKITHFEVSCKENAGVDVFKKKLIHLLPNREEPRLIGDLVGQRDVVLMVVPID